MINQPSSPEETGKRAHENGFVIAGEMDAYGDVHRDNVFDGYGIRVAAAVAYMTSAVALLLLNNALALTFPFTFTVLIIQALFTVFLSGIIVLFLWKYHNTPPYIFSWKEVLQFLPVVVFFVLILVSGFEVLKFVSLVTFIALRYLTCFTSWIGEILLLGKPFQWELIPSLSIIVAGA